MTVNELIERLSALSEAERQKPAYVSGEWVSEIDFIRPITGECQGGPEREYASFVADGYEVG